MGYHPYPTAGAAVVHQRSLPANFVLEPLHGSAADVATAHADPNGGMPAGHLHRRDFSTSPLENCFMELSAWACMLLLLLPHNLALMQWPFCRPHARSTSACIQDSPAAQSADAHASHAQQAQALMVGPAPSPQQLRGSFPQSQVSAAWQRHCSIGGAAQQHAPAASRDVLAQQQQHSVHTNDHATSHMTGHWGQQQQEGYELATGSGAGLQIKQPSYQPSSGAPQQQEGNNEQEEEGPRDSQEVLLISSGSNAQHREMDAGLLTSVAEAHAPTSTRQVAPLPPDALSSNCTIYYTIRVTFACNSAVRGHAVFLVGWQAWF